MPLRHCREEQKCTLRLRKWVWQAHRARQRSRSRIQSQLLRTGTQFSSPSLQIPRTGCLSAWAPHEHLAAHKPPPRDSIALGLRCAYLLCGKIDIVGGRDACRASLNPRFSPDMMCETEAISPGESLSKSHATCFL